MTLIDSRIDRPVSSSVVPRPPPAMAAPAPCVIRVAYHPEGLPSACRVIRVGGGAGAATPSGRGLRGPDRARGPRRGGRPISLRRLGGSGARLGGLGAWAEARCPFCQASERASEWGGRGGEEGGSERGARRNKEGGRGGEERPPGLRGRLARGQRVDLFLMLSLFGSDPKPMRLALHFMK